MKDKYAHLSYVVPGVEIKLATMRVTGSKGAHLKAPVYPMPGDQCTEKGFLHYVTDRRDELRIRVPNDSERRMRRLLRDYAKSRGGLPHSVSLWTNPGDRGHLR